MLKFLLLVFYFNLATIGNEKVTNITLSFTSFQVFSTRTVQHTLSLMHSCGMYDYSGQFAFHVSLLSSSLLLLLLLLSWLYFSN